MPGVQAEVNTGSLVAKADSNLVCPACRGNVAERSDVREIGIGNRRVVQRDVDHGAEEIRAQPIQQPLGSSGDHGRGVANRRESVRQARYGVPQRQRRPTNALGLTHCVQITSWWAGNM